MEKYSVIEEIGRSKHAVVYKGRQKRTILYHALKCIAKSNKSVVLHEVNFIHSLDHPHIMRFYEWFETANHLWLILEYCTGGSLLLLLQQDMKLPESSVHQFGFEMGVGLQFLHSLGIIYGNLKPATVLIDGEGRLKLSDFSLASRVTEGRGAGQHKRVTPAYTAPELFQDDGVPSFQSDFWSFGCVMYELSAGRAPFMSTSFKDLLYAILNDHPQTVSNVSDEFAYLIDALLAKDPMERPNWEELTGHPFWKKAFPALQMPSQPLFDALQDSVMDMAGDDSNDRSTHGVDVLRLSRNVRTHLVEEEDLSYRDHNVTQDDVHLHNADVQVDLGGSNSGKKISEAVAANRGDDGVGFAGGSTSPQLMGRGGGGNKQQQQQQLQQQDGGLERDFGGLALQGRGMNDLMVTGVKQNAPTGFQPAAAKPQQQQQQSSRSNNNNNNRGDDGDDDEEEIVEDVVDETEEEEAVAAVAKKTDEMIIRSSRTDLERTMSRAASASSTRPTSAPARPLPHQGVASPLSSKVGTPIISYDPNARPPTVSQENDGVIGFTGGAGGGGGTGVSGEVAPLEELLYHSSDAQVRPIVLNKRIERTTMPPCDHSKLVVEYISLDQVLQFAPEQTEDFLRTLYNALAGKSPVSEKINILAYLEELCVDSGVADVFLNSALTGLFGNMLKATKVAPLRLRIVHLIGLLLRHASYVSAEVVETGLIEKLSEQIRTADEKVRRRSMAAVGELIFYHASQSLEENVPVDEQWNLPPGVFATLTRSLRTNEDEIVQHYAAQTIDNLGSSNTEHMLRMATQENALLLLTIVDSSKNDPLRATAASALSRLVRYKDSLVGAIVDKMGAKTLVEHLADSTAKTQQAFFSILNEALRNPTPRILKSLSEVDSLIPAVLRQLDNTSPVVRAKALLTVQLLSQSSPQWLVTVCEKKLLPILDRLSKDKDEYVAACLASLRMGLKAAIPVLAQTVTAELERLCSARRTPPSTSSDAVTAASGKLRGPLSLLPALQHMSSNPSMRDAIATPPLIASLAQWLVQIEGVVFTGQSEFRRVLTLVLETLIQQAEILLANSEAIVHSLLPPLISLLSVENADTRFVCLKLVTDVCQTLMAEPSAYDPATRSTQTTPVAQLTRAINELVVKQLLPKYKSLLSDKDPIIIYATRLLSTVLDLNPAFAAVVQRVGLAPRFVQFLELDSPHNNVHNVRLIRRLVENADDIAALYSLGLATKVTQVVLYMYNASVDTFLEPVLGIVSSLLYGAARAIQQSPREGGSSSSSAISPAGNDGINNSNKDVWYERNEPFVATTSAMTDLSAHSDTAVSEKASYCLLLLARLYPASVGSSLSPPSISRALSSSQPAVQKRLLKALLWIGSGGDSEILETLFTDPSLLGAVEQLGDDPDASISALAQDVLKRAPVEP